MSSDGDPSDPARRDLFFLGAAAVAVAALPACAETDGAAWSGGAAPGPAAELEEATIAELQRRMASGQETARSLVAKYRARIAALDGAGAGPALRSILELDPDADAVAAQLDRERAGGHLRGPLHGIPIAVKDNIDTTTMTTTGGSLALAGSRPPKDAYVVARLRDAGAVVFAKANLSEWANFRGVASSSGWSARGGQCRNPYALDRSPSGSSSGSAVAVAANLCAAALGTETDGSVTSPASCNALVGVKPTIGLVSRAGVIPISPSQDTVGPMARTVTDAAILLTAIAGLDPDDPPMGRPPAPLPAATDYTAQLDRDALRGARLGVPRTGFFGFNRNVDAIMTAALVQLQALGAELVDPSELVAPPELLAAELEVFYFEMKAAMDAYLATRGQTVRARTLADLVAFNKDHAAEELFVFGQEHFEASLAKGGLDDPGYIAARATCVQIARGLLDKGMDEGYLDAFVAPTSCLPWLIDHVNGDGPYGPSATSLPAIAGYPHVTVPAGDFRGLPLGLSFIGRPYTESKLLAYAFAWEQASTRRQRPRYPETITLA
jgi:amidase